MATTLTTTLPATLSSKSANVASYSGVSKAYTFYLEVILNSQSIDNNTSNITINHYAKGNGDWYYEQFSSPKSYIKIYDNNTGTTVTKATTTVASIPNGTKKLIGTWTGNVTHKPDGTLNINVTAEYKSNVTSYNYVPANSSISTGTLSLPDLHTPPSVGDVTFVENNAALTEAGIEADVFVPYLSNKTATIEATPFDDATISKYEITDGTTVFENANNDVTMDLSKGLAYSGTSTELTVKVTDSMGSVGSETIKKTVIPYTVPNLITTSSNVKRNGQTTGKARLNLVGTFFNNAIGSIANIIALSFAYWKSGDTESTTYNEIPADAYTINGNNITISNWPIAVAGTEITDVDKESAYKFKIKAVDAFNKESAIELTCTAGEYLMAKYKDRVDFKKITQNGVPILGKVLFEGDTNEDITLSDSAENYDYLEIFYRNNDYWYTSTKVDTPNGKKVSLACMYNNGTRLYWKAKGVYINGKSITNINYIETRQGNNESTIATNSNHIYITKILGYRR